MSLSMADVDMRIKVPRSHFLFPCISSKTSLIWPHIQKGCAFNHDPHKMNPANNSDRLGYPYSWKTQYMCVWNRQWLTSGFHFSRKRFNVDSPSFTPSLLSANGSTATTPTKKTATISPKAANAAPFQPRSVSSRMALPLSSCQGQGRTLTYTRF